MGDDSDVGLPPVSPGRLARGQALLREAGTRFSQATTAWMRLLEAFCVQFCGRAEAHTDLVPRPRVRPRVRGPRQMPASERQPVAAVAASDLPSCPLPCYSPGIGAPAVPGRLGPSGPPPEEAERAGFAYLRGAPPAGVSLLPRARLRPERRRVDLTGAVITPYALRPAPAGGVAEEVPEFRFSFWAPDASDASDLPAPQAEAGAASLSCEGPAPLPPFSGGWRPSGPIIMRSIYDDPAAGAGESPRAFEAQSARAHRGRRTPSVSAKAGGRVRRRPARSLRCVV